MMETAQNSYFKEEKENILLLMLLSLHHLVASVSNGLQSVANKRDDSSQSQIF